MHISTFGVQPINYSLSVSSAATIRVSIVSQSIRLKIGSMGQFLLEVRTMDMKYTNGHSHFQDRRTRKSL
jgi:hypothetical protein